MNNVTLMGRITKDLELKYSATGETAILSFNVAVNRKFSKEKEADFINCKAFKKTAENIAKFFQKGSLIALEGRIKTGSHEKEGKKIYTTDVIVDSFHFTGEKKKDSEEGFTPVGDVDDDLLPF